MTEKRLIDVSNENVKATLGKYPYYPDEIWKFTAMTEKFPTVDVAPVRHGRWVDTDSEFAQCSLCKYPVYAAWNATNYCPNCGAKMDGGTQ